MGVSRGMMYYKHKKQDEDAELAKQIEAILVKKPQYGHKRVALALKIGHERARRVMKLHNLSPAPRTKRKFKKSKVNENEQKLPNISLVLCPIKPNIVWVTDFTYIKYQSKFIYLATIIDPFTRLVLGYEISRYHNANLVTEALLDALSKHKPPQYLHSDRGVEYTGEKFKEIAKDNNIQLSLSNKASPWQNGYQESFFGHFKQDLGNPNNHNSLPELVEAIQLAIYDYNNDRIHSKLKMTPSEFAKLHERIVCKKTRT